MRLDLVLKESRLIKRRTVAKELCLSGRILVNDKEAKPSFEVKENDIITVKIGQKNISVKITYKLIGKRLIPSYEEIGNVNA